MVGRCGHWRIDSRLRLRVPWSPVSKEARMDDLRRRPWWSGLAGFVAIAAAVLALPAVAGAVTITEFSAGISKPANVITAGPDGNLWFTEGGTSIGRITPAAQVTEFGAGITGESSGIAAGPDGALWFTEPSAHKIGRITTAGVVTEFGAG